MNPLFYFLIALTAVLAATANAGGPVLDINGDVIFGGSYYVLPAISGPAGGGLNLVPFGDKQCPLYIGQESSEVERGIPVKFSNWRSRVGFVPESADLNIEMDAAATICVQSNYWSVVPLSLPNLNFYVEAGPKPNPGVDSWKSFFRIKKTEEFHNGYSIAFCPNGGACMSVGISTDEYGVRRLALLDSTPFPVVFMKASETETSPKTISII